MTGHTTPSDGWASKLRVADETEAQKELGTVLANIHDSIARAKVCVNFWERSVHSGEDILGGDLKETLATVFLQSLAIGDLTI